MSENKFASALLPTFVFTVVSGFFGRQKISFKQVFLKDNRGTQEFTGRLLSINSELYYF